MNKKFSPAQLPGIIVSMFLIAGLLTLGILNLFGTSSVYTADASAMINSTLGSIIAAYFGLRSFLLGAAVLVAVSVLVCALLKAASVHRGAGFVLIVLAAAFALRAAAVYAWKSEPQSDFLITYELSALLAKTPFSAWGEALDEYGTIYNNIWSAHMPFVIYQSFVMRFAGESTVVLGLVNAAWGTLSCAAAALTADKIFAQPAGRNALLLMAFNPVCIFFTPIISNQHPAMFFLILCVLIGTTVRHSIFRAFLLGIIFAAGQLMRPEFTPVIAAAVLYFLYEGVKNKKKLRGILCCIIMLVVFLSLTAAADRFLYSNGVIHGSLLEQNLKYKLAVGMNPDTKGCWSAEDELLIYDSTLLDETFAQRLKSFNFLLPIEKVIYQFGTFVYNWSMKTSAHPIISDILVRRFCAAMMGMISVFACAEAVFDGKNRQRLLFVTLILGAYMAVYSLIEIQDRYNYTVLPLIVILGSNIVLSGTRKKESVPHEAGKDSDE